MDLAQLLAGLSILTNTALTAPLRLALAMLHAQAEDAVIQLPVLPNVVPVVTRLSAIFAMISSAQTATRTHHVSQINARPMLKMMVLVLVNVALDMYANRTLTKKFVTTAMESVQLV